MRSMPENICLIIPCFNERVRLASNAEAFGRCPFDLLFVSDGSTDGTAEWVRSQRKANWGLLELPANAGKADAVRQGMLAVRNKPDFSALSWIGYWDADLSTPLEEVDNLLLYRNTFHPDAQAILASRVSRLGSRIRRSYVRHVLGRLFATLVGFLFPRIHVYDSQCGAKLFKPELVDTAFSKPFKSRWLFDIEILLRLQKVLVIESPLLTWEEKPGGKLRVMTVLFRVIWDLGWLRTSYKR